MNTSGSPADIMKWKKKPAVTKCYNQLFTDNFEALMAIFDKVFGPKKYTNLQMAYVIAICTTFLNPKNNRIKCKKNAMKRKIQFYLVSFYFYFIIINIWFNNLII